MQAWLETPPGQYLLDWERARFGVAVADIFGYHSLQLGLPMLDALHSSRMPHRWLALEELAPAASLAPVALVTDFTALPFSAASLDLLVLPHTLELSADPHATLREVARVLVPQGRVVLSGLNPVSFWGLAQWRARLYQRFGLGGSMYVPELAACLGSWRVCDWLHVLGFELEAVHFGCYRPAVQSPQWLQRHAWLEPVGARWWPILGAAYVIVAVKRVPAMRLLNPPKKAPRALKLAPI